MISHYDIDGRMGYNIVSRMQARIVKAVKETHCRVTHGALSMLEPYEEKVSRTVLRGLGGGNISRLPDIGTSLRFVPTM